MFKKVDVFINSGTTKTREQIIAAVVTALNAKQAAFMGQNNTYTAYLYAEFVDPKNGDILRVFSDAAKAYLNMASNFVLLFDRDLTANTFMVATDFIV